MKHQFVAKTPKVVLHTFTPQECQFYLDRYNTRNRKIRPYNVQKYAMSMVNGTFTLNVDCIAFYNDKELANGQNRFSAAVLAGKPFQAFVMYGLNPAIRINIDTGAPRTMTDSATIEDGSCVTSKMSTIATNWYRFENNWIAQGKTPREILQCFLREKETPIMEIARLAKNKQGLGKAGFLTAAAIYADQHLDDAIRFVNEVNTGIKEDGVGLIPTDPAFRLREYLRETRGGSGVNITQDAEKTFFAINAWANHLPCARLGNKTKLVL